MLYQQERIEAALEAARQCLNARFNGASHLFVAGSIMRGEGNAFSDIDLVVLFPKVPRGWRESFMMDGFPIEAFVHDSETLAYFIEQDIRSGAPVIVHMVANGGGPRAGERHTAMGARASRERPPAPGRGAL